MRKPTKLFFSVLLLFMFFTARAGAEPVLKLLKDIEVHGFASSSYTFNFNDPDGNSSGGATNVNRIFDTDHDSFKFDVGELVLLKEASNPGDIGFRTDLTYGFSVPEVAKSSVGPNVGGADVADDDFDVQEAFVSYNAPVGNGLVLDFGKFTTHIGAEVIEGYDGWNYNFSRSFLFGLAIPFTHTGLRAGYAFNDRFAVTAMIVNGWDNTTDNNDGKSVGIQLAIVPLDGVDLYLNWMGGPEQSGRGDMRNIFDVVLDIALSDRTLLQVNFDYGTEQDSSNAFPGEDAVWWGFAGILRHDYNEWFSINLRGEFFNDQDGTRASSGTMSPFTPGQELWEITITPEVRVNQNLVVRFEYRHDQSNEMVFNNEDSSPILTSGQDTLAVNALFYF